LTGNAAVLGIDSVPAIQMAIDQVNATGGIAGEKLVLAVEDDQYITAKTVAAYNHLTRNRGARVIFVLTYGGLAAVAPKAERDGVILIDTLDSDEETAKLPGNTFCIAKTTESMGRKLAGDSIKGMFGLAFIAPRNDALKKFEVEFKSRVGRVWRFETSTISSYDAMTLVARSVAESGGLSRNESGAAVISTDRLRERLLSVKGYQGLSGVITIDPDGITRSLDVRAVEFGVDGVVRVL
jgi:ABC-type branched-subunit amino acid transport system substrate-binding protein